MSHPYSFEVLVSQRVENLLAEADRDQLVALAQSGGTQQSAFAPIALVNLVRSLILVPAYAALLSRTASSL
jgi:hypothetical protein